MPDTSRRSRLVRDVVLALLVVALHAGDLAGPLRDGQGGNCGAMFGLMARNARELGLAETAAVPLVNPVPPGPEGTPVPYTHHPPGLPWAVMAADRVVGDEVLGGRLVALVLSVASVLLLARLGERLGGAATGWAAGLLLALLPAGRTHGLLVNYETIALPPLIGLTGALVLARGRATLWAAAAALADWPALFPLAFAARPSAWRRLLAPAAVAATVVVLVFAHGRLAASHTTGETLGQALLATFLNPAFEAGDWLRAAAQDGLALYGPLALLTPLALLQPDEGDVPRRRVLAALFASGAANVVLFAWHATTHEHFWLVLAPAVALGGACLAFPRAGRPTPLGAALVVALLITGWVFGGHAPTRTTTHERATGLASVTEAEAVYVTPAGVTLVFLHGAERHVWPYGVANLEAARAAGASHDARFGTEGLPLWLAVGPDETLPTWALALEGAEVRDGWTLVPLPR